MSVSSQSLTMFFDDYINHLRFERLLSENSIIAYSVDLQRFISFLADSGVDDFNNATKDHIVSFLKLLKDLDLQPKSLIRYHSSLKNFFGYLLVNNYITHNPVDNVRASKVPKNLPEVLSVDEIDKIFNQTDSESFSGIRDRAILEVLYACGIRVSELTDLKMSYLFLDDEAIRVFGKGSKERFVPIGLSAIKWVKRYISEVRPIFYKERKSFDNVFLSQKRGTPLTRQAVWQLIQSYTVKAGIDRRVYPHIFRHSFATHLIEGGANLRAVQEMLGHTDISVTQIYTNIDRNFVIKEHKLYHPRG